MTSQRFLPSSRSFAASVVATAVLTFAAIPAFAFAQAEKKEEGPPKDVEMTWTSKDGVVLKATYWEPEDANSSTVPIILLHGFEGKRQEYDVLAGQLQKLGHMVVSLDLLGHGGSTTVRRPDLPMDLMLTPDKLARGHLERMVFDVHEAKKFLMEKHKENKCNIKLLCVVGADMGALVAVNYAAYDWSQIILPRPRSCKGQDVRALVLLSPPNDVKGMTATKALEHPAVQRLSTMIIAGDKDNNKAFRDAKTLHSRLEKFHPTLPRDEKDPMAWKEKNMDLFFLSPNPSTSLQGTTLLTQQALNVDDMIIKFIELRLENKADDPELAWAERD